MRVRLTGAGSAAIRRKLGMGRGWPAECGGGLRERLPGLGDAFRDLRGAGIDRERKTRDEIQVALDTEAEPTRHALQFGEADIAEFGTAHAEVAEAEQDVRL